MAIDDKLVTLGDLKTVIDNTHDSTKQDTLTFDTTPTQGSTNPVTSGGVYTGLNGKVDKENGKGLSTNDFTDADKQKLAELSQYVGAGIIFDTASGSVASFTDGGDGLPVKSVSVDVDPVQDLHGYSKPWSGGAGKNLLPLTVDGIKTMNGGASSWSGNSKTINGVTFTINTDSAGNVTGIKANGTASASTWLILGSINDFAAGTYILDGTPPTGTSSTYYLALTDSTIGFTPEYGSGVNIVKGASDTGRIGINIRTNYNANNLVFKPMIRLASVSDATFEPYSNICPITGWTGANVTRTGKNLLNKVTATISVVETWLNENIHLKAGTYTFSFVSSNINGKFTFNVFDSNNNRIYNAPSLNLTSGICKHTFTIASDGARITSYINVASTLSNVQLEKGSTATEYEAYNGQSVTIALGDTIYGGVLDVTNGTLIVNRAAITPVPYRIGTASVSGLSYADCHANIVQNANIVSNMYQWALTDATGTDGMIKAYANEITIYDKRFTTLEEAESILSDCQVVYTIANPTTYNLAPQEITTLLGINHVWADTGEVSVEYAADPKLYINKVIANALNA